VSITPPKEPPITSVKLKLPPFEVLRGAEIWRPRPPMKYVIEGFLPVGCLGMLCALGSSHKSWLLSDAALAVAKGREWLNAFPTGDPRRVLYMDYENNEDETARRIMGLEQEPIDNLHLAVMPDLFLTDKTFLPEIHNLARQYDLIAIDSLSGGSQDISENDVKFAQCLRQMKRAAAKTGCSFLILHHSRKPQRGRDGEEIEEANKKNKPRGTGAIYNALDALLDIENIDDSRSHVVHTKKRGAGRLEPFTVCIEGTAPDPTRLFVLSSKEVAESSKAAKLKRKFAEYQKVWDGKSISANGMVKVVKHQRARVLEELQAFVKLEWLSLNDGFYSVPQEASPAGSRRGSKKEGVGNHLKLVPVPSGSGAREPAEPA
jgi:hypothetical protein